MELVDSGPRFAETQTTPDSNPWTSQNVSLSGTPQPIGDGAYERVTVRVDLVLEAEPRMFLRLRVDLGG